MSGSVGEDIIKELIAVSYQTGEILISIQWDLEKPTPVDFEFPWPTVSLGVELTEDDEGNLCYGAMIAPEHKELIDPENKVSPT